MISTSSLLHVMDIISSVIASNTQMAPLHKKNPSVKPFPKPKCPCTWSTSTPRALWLHMQNWHIREGGTFRHSWSSACTFLLHSTPSMTWTQQSLAGLLYPCTGILWFPAGSECPALKSKTGNHLDTTTIKCAGKQVRLKIHYNKHLKIHLLSQVWNASGDGTLKHSCSQGSLKIRFTALWQHSV